MRRMGQSFMAALITGFLLLPLFGFNVPVAFAAQPTIYQTPDGMPLRQAEAPEPTGGILVKLKDGCEIDTVLAGVDGVQLVEQLPLVDNLFSLKTSGAAAEAVVQRLMKRKEVEFAEIDDLPAPQAVADDRHEQQWYLVNDGQVIELIKGAPGFDINVQEAWDATRGDGVIVAVMDGPMDINHPDLAENIYRNEAELSGTTGVDDDGNGYIDDIHGWNTQDNTNQVYWNSTSAEHATHIAGVIAAAQNDFGIIGVAPKAKILPICIEGVNGRSSESAVIKGLDYAAKMGAKVVNFSQVFAKRPLALESAMDKVEGQLVIVCSAGNNGNNLEEVPTYPSVGSTSNIFSVASVRNDGRLATDSDYSTKYVDIAAPGDNIMSTYPEGRYAYASGTSMAAPMVSGLMALLYSVEPDLYPYEAISRVVASCMKVDGMEDKVRACGMIDCTAALKHGSSKENCPAFTRVVGTDTQIRANWYYSTSYTHKYELEFDGQTIVQSASSYIAANLLPDSYHFLRVRAVETRDEETYYSPWSASYYVHTLKQGDGNGLWAEYYREPEQVNLAGTRFVPNIDFSGAESFQLSSFINPDQFGASFTGTISTRYDEDTYLSVKTTGGVRLTVNGEVLLDKYYTYPKAETEYTVSVPMRGEHVSLRLDYSNMYKTPSLKLYWWGNVQTGKQVKEIVPKQYLHTYNSKGEWKPSDELPYQLINFAAQPFGDAFYLFGGAKDSGVISRDVWRYDPAAGTYTNLGTMPSARVMMASVSTDSGIYLLGGTSNGMSTNVVERYDPTTGQFTTLSPMPAVRHYMGTTLLNNKIYLFGGTDTQTGAAYSDIWIYDIASDTWSEAGQMPACVKGCVVETINGIIHVMGGTVGSASSALLSAHYSYNPNTGEWTHYAHLPIEVSYASSAVFHGKLYVAGGIISQGVNLGTSSNVYVYDPETELWDAVASLRTSKAYGQLVPYQQHLYYFGGSTRVESGYVYTNTVERYQFFATSDITSIYGEDIVDAQVDLSNLRIDITAKNSADISKLQFQYTLSTQEEPLTADPIDFVAYNPNYLGFTDFIGIQYIWEIHCKQAEYLPAAWITADADAYYLTVGQERAVQVEVQPAASDERITGMQTVDPSVAEVVDGVLYARGAGQTQLRLSTELFERSLPVVVSDVHADGSVRVCSGGVGIPNVEAQLKKDGRLITRATSNEQGIVDFSGVVPEGDYTVACAAEGFAEAVMPLSLPAEAVELTLTDIAPPVFPSVFVKADKTNMTSVHLSWMAAQDNTAVSRYSVALYQRHYDTGGETLLKQVETEAADIVINQLQPGESYQAVVTAWDLCGLRSEPIRSVQFRLPENNRALAGIGAGPNRVLFISAEGKLYGAGANSNGELGTGAVGRTATPEEAYDLSRVVGVASGANHSIAVDLDGLVYTWGSNSRGQLGRGNYMGDIIPTRVPSLTGIIKVTAGNGFCLALTQTGEVWAWGMNNAGQLGTGNYLDTTVPVLIPSLSGIVDIASGEAHSLALTREGTVYAWGDNQYRQLASAAVSANAKPVVVEGIPPLTAVACGKSNCGGLDADGHIYVWGDNRYGQLLPDEETAVKPSALEGSFGALALGADVLLALRSDGTVWSKGNNANGQLGRSLAEGQTVDRTLAQVDRLEGMIALCAGDQSAYAMSRQGDIYVFGRGTIGELGTGEYQNEPLPVLLEFNMGFFGNTPVASVLSIDVLNAAGNPVSEMRELVPGEQVRACIRLANETPDNKQFTGSMALYTAENTMHTLKMERLTLLPGEIRDVELVIDKLPDDLTGAVLKVLTWENFQTMRELAMMRVVS